MTNIMSIRTNVVVEIATGGEFRIRIFSDHPGLLNSCGVVRSAQDLLAFANQIKNIDGIPPPSSLFLSNNESPFALFVPKKMTEERVRDYIQSLFIAIPLPKQIFPFLRLYPNLASKVIIITGSGGDGIGPATARELAGCGRDRDRPLLIIMAGRNKEKADALRQQIEEENLQCGGGVVVAFMELDLASVVSIRRFVSEFLGTNLPLHVLINNAGVFNPPDRAVTEEGFEVHIGVNYLGGVLLTELLLPVLRTSESSRVIFLSSRAHHDVSASAINWSQSFARTTEETERATSFWDKWRNYQISKLGVAMYAAEKGRERSNPSFFFAHPGMVDTALWQRLPFLIRKPLSPFVIPAHQAAMGLVFIAAHAGLEEHSGRYFDHGDIAEPNPAVEDEMLRRNCLIETYKVLETV